MSKQTSMSIVPSEPEMPWGKAHRLRGIGYHEAAIAFSAAYPVGTTITPQEFDLWASTAGHLSIPPNTTDRNSDSWLAHLQKRHQFKYRLNTAGSHPRMTEAGHKPFVIETLSKGPEARNQVWEVRSPEQAIARTDIAKRIDSLVSTKRKQLEHLMQSADWAQLPPAERIVSEELHTDITNYEERIDLESKQLGRKFAALRMKMQKSIASGEIVPKNDAMKEIVEDVNE